jgi:hypothetical protein
MGHSSKDRHGSLLYITAGHSPTAFMNLQRLHHRSVCSLQGSFVHSSPNITLPSCLHRLSKLFQCLSRYSPDLLLLRYRSKYPTCAPPDSVWSFAGYLDTVSFLQRGSQSGSFARIASLRPGSRHWHLRLHSSCYFTLVASRVERRSLQQTAYGENICARVAVLFHSRPVGRSPPFPHPDRPDSWRVDTCCERNRRPSYSGTCLGGLPSSHRNPGCLSPWRLDLRHTRR